MIFSASTYLYRHRRLLREHLLEIAAYGFTAVELFASRLHVDYHNPAVIADVQQWLSEAGLQLTSVHSPVLEISLASADAAERDAAVEETERALHIGRRLPFGTFVIHLGRPRADNVRGGTNRDAARRSVETLAKTAEPLGVRIGIEVIPNDLCRPASLAHLMDEDIEARNAGICLDAGHARLEGDVADAVETVSGHLVAIDLHDNRGRADDHMVPFDGTIDWPAALTAVQKVGYDGPVTFELSARGSTKDTLARARDARRRMQGFMRV
ncbi:MAG TPA: sugar phosphate isomerase/epimerase family protein [Vicinamibacterales bacterium]|nr:sugar phosphate isomerase/epimerase family protein [Vicinamibacterales bacterium]